MEQTMKEQTVGYGVQSQTVGASTTAEAVRSPFELQRMRDEQNLPMGVIAGFVAAILGALVWAVITAVTQRQFGIMAIAVGGFVGYATQKFGKGVDQIYGVMAAILALFGCVAGNFVCILILAAADGLPLSVMMSRLTPDFVVYILKETFEVMDVLFYGIAVVMGYRVALRRS